MDLSPRGLAKAARLNQIILFQYGKNFLRVQWSCRQTSVSHNKILDAFFMCTDLCVDLNLTQYFLIKKDFCEHLLCHLIWLLLVEKERFSCFVAFWWLSLDCKARWTAGVLYLGCDVTTIKLMQYFMSTLLLKQAKSDKFSFPSEVYLM